MGVKLGLVSIFAIPCTQSHKPHNRDRYVLPHWKIRVGLAVEVSNNKDYFVGRQRIKNNNKWHPQRHRETVKEKKIRHKATKLLSDYGRESSYSVISVLNMSAPIFQAKKNIL